MSVQKEKSDMQIKKLNKKIGYGYLYLSLIPVFAVIYTLLPEGYIHYDQLSNNFLTNLYYSAVTVTTLGYGDITPVNEIAALLVGAESVLGVVIIGLFLNQISHYKMEQEKIQEEQNEIGRAMLRETDRLLQYAAVIQEIDNPDKMEEAVKDFILNIDMHDFRSLEKICLIYLSDKDFRLFRLRFEVETYKIECNFEELKQKYGDTYWG